MLGCNLGGYIRACASVTGGVSDLLVADANDFNFTAGAADINGDPTGYNALAIRDEAAGYASTLLFPIQSVEDQIGVDIQQANADGSSSSYEYTIAARLAQMSQQMTNFNAKLDAAALCCQMLFVWRNNDGKIFVAGEKYVNDEAIIKFKFRQDGTKVSTGKKFSEFNGEDLVIKGTYFRKPYEYTGAWSTIQAFIAS